MPNNLWQLANISHITTMYFQIIDVPTLYKSIICSSWIPCANVYNAIFTTFQIGQGACINILAYEFKNKCNCSKRVKTQKCHSIGLQIFFIQHLWCSVPNTPFNNVKMCFSPWFFPSHPLRMWFLVTKKNKQRKKPMH